MDLVDTIRFFCIVSSLSLMFMDIMIFSFIRSIGRPVKKKKKKKIEIVPESESEEEEEDEGEK